MPPSYNKMVDDLAESTKKIAEDSRQKTWSEMARRIAHEIKNPLTPMQLSIQRLINLKRKNAPGWEDKLEDIAKSLLEQMHYFWEKETMQILREIQRILLPGGHLIFRVNSVNDIHHGAGKGTEVEHHVYETDAGTLKRFFDEADIRRFFSEFQIEYVHEEIMTRYQFEKRLFRGCVRKAEDHG